MKLERSSVLREDYYCILLDEDEDEDDMLYDVCTNNSKKHWRNGIVLYVLNKNVKGKFKNSVRKGMDKISDACAVEFVEINKPSNNMNYIEINKGGKFASSVGMKGGKQGLLVAEGWPHPIGHVMHELMHALGFHHEHSRPDRDDNVIVNNNNKNKNYDKLKESEVICFGPYDYESIMHYPLGNITLKKVKVEIGQREKLSNGDIYALNKLYPREKLLRSRREALVRGNEELERVSNRSPVDNDRKEELKKEIRILEKILERYDDNFMNLPQTSGPRM